MISSRLHLHQPKRVDSSCTKFSLSVRVFILNFSLYYTMIRLCLSLAIISIVITILWSSDGYTVHNSLLAGHVFKTVVSIDWLQCIEECHKHNICVSYNYFPPEKVCELNVFGFYDRCGADDNLIQANGWIHHVLRTSQVKHRHYYKNGYYCRIFHYSAEKSPSHLGEMNTNI